MIKHISSAKGVMLILAACTIFLSACQKEEAIDLKLQEEAAWDMSDNGKIIEGKYIVVLRGEAVSALKSAMSYTEKRTLMRNEIARLLPEKELETDMIEHVYINALFGFSASLNDNQLRKLKNNEMIEFIEEDRIITLGKPPWAGGEEASTGDTGQEIPWGVLRVGSSDGTEKTAWIIDTGIDLDHPDLNVDLGRAFSVFTKGKDTTPDDNNGHGSHVAGTIAAVNNDLGVLGVAAGAMVVPVKVLDSRGSGTYSGVIEGVDYVAENAGNGDVANMSLGGPASKALDLAVLNAAEGGVIFALAAGNDGDDANGLSPARVNHPNVYTISAMDSNDEWAYFSNYANPPVDYCAPGVAIKSTWKQGGYKTISGTSMAAPHAAGVLMFGNASPDGTVSGDPDGTNDPIIHQ